MLSLELADSVIAFFNFVVPSRSEHSFWGRSLRATRRLKSSGGEMGGRPPDSLSTSLHLRVGARRRCFVDVDRATCRIQAQEPKEKEGALAAWVAVEDERWRVGGAAPAIWGTVNRC